LGGSPTTYITNTWATGTSLKLEPIKFCHWAAPRYGDIGQKALNTVLAAVAFIVAYKSLEAQIEINDMRQSIADSYAKIFEDRWNRYKTAYMPLEAAMIQEIMNTPVPVVDCSSVKSNYTSFVTNAFGENSQRLTAAASKYCLCVDKSLTEDLNLSRAIMVDDSVNFGYRFDEMYVIQRDDVRWNKRSNLLNLGRDLLAQSAKYSATADNLLAGLGEAAGKAFSGAVGYLGYYFNRQQTEYPSQYAQSSLSGGALDFGMRGVGDMGPNFVTAGGIQSGQF